MRQILALCCRTSAILSNYLSAITMLLNKWLFKMTRGAKFAPLTIYFKISISFNKWLAPASLSMMNKA